MRIMRSDFTDVLTENAEMGSVQSANSMQRVDTCIDVPQCIPAGERVLKEGWPGQGHVRCAHRVHGRAHKQR